MGYRPWGHKESDTTEPTAHACANKHTGSGSPGPAYTGSLGLQFPGLFGPEASSLADS